MANAHKCKEWKWSKIYDCPECVKCGDILIERDILRILNAQPRTKFRKIPKYDTRNGQATVLVYVNAGRQLYICTTEGEKK